MTEPTANGLSWRTIFKFFALFVIAGLLYAAYPPLMARFGLRAPSWVDDLIRALLLNISMAGAIGAFIELFAARDLIRSASREIASRVMAQHLPEGFDDRIRQIVHGTSVVLEDWTATFIVTEEDTEHVRVTIDEAFRAQNYSSRPEPYQTVNAEEAVYKPTFDLLEVVHNGQQQPCTIAPEVRQETEAVEAKGPKIGLAPHGKPGDSCSVHWRFHVIAPKRYSYIIAFGTPTLNPRIRVLHSPGFSVFAAKSDTSESTATTWSYQRAYLPGQHLRVWWKPSDVPEPV